MYYRQQWVGELNRSCTLPPPRGGLPLSNLHEGTQPHSRPTTRVRAVSSGVCHSTPVAWAGSFLHVAACARTACCDRCGGRARVQLPLSLSAVPLIPCSAVVSGSALLQTALRTPLVVPLLPCSTVTCSLALQHSTSTSELARITQEVRGRARARLTARHLATASL